MTDNLPPLPSFEQWQTILNPSIPGAQIASLEAFVQAYARAALAQAQSQSLPDGPPYVFRRFVDGKRMAEDVEIHLSKSLDEAVSKAARICPKGKNTVLVLASPALPVQPAADLTTELAECKAAYESQFKELHALKAQRDALLEALKSADQFIDGIRQDLHHERVADWYPEGAHNSAEAMSESMRLMGNRCADFVDASEAIAAAEKGGAS